MEKKTIRIEQTIHAPIDKVWQYFTSPEHIVQWNFAADDWISPRAENDLRPGGKFNYRMEARNGQYGFDFWGVYDNVEEKQLIEYTLGDNRKVSIQFSASGDQTIVTEDFEAEETNPVEMQQAGWQSILDNFKNHCESGQQIQG